MVAYDVCVGDFIIFGICACMCNSHECSRILAVI